jgi:para-nitrobenzyl esterase
MRFGPASVQPGNALGSVMPAQEVDWSEDCLFLNVQTPACDDARRPVMVWLHGGGFVNGTGATPWYDGANLVTRGDVVVVSINYRLGVLGWLHLGEIDPSFASSGNNGLLDQIAALDWVQRNIASFGGNPDDVTIFGESAGGMSVATLLGTPRAAGLFHKAIPQSGAAHNVVSAARASAVAAGFLERCGATTVGDLQEVPAQQVLEIQTDLAADFVSSQRGGGRGDRAGPARGLSALGLPFGPVLDGEVLPEPPIDVVRRGGSASVPLLVGTTRDEFTLFGLMMRAPDDAEALRRRVARLVDDP